MFYFYLSGYYCVEFSQKRKTKQTRTIQNNNQKKYKQYNKNTHRGKRSQTQNQQTKRNKKPNKLTNQQKTPYPHPPKKQTTKNPPQQARNTGQDYRIFNEEKKKHTAFLTLLTLK